MRKLVLVFVTSLAAGTAMAAPVSWTASGTIIWTSQADQLPLNAQVGEAFSYSMVFDDATPDLASWDELGHYVGAVTSATFSIGDRSFDLPIGPDGNVQIYEYPVDPSRGLIFQTEGAPRGTYPTLFSQLAIWSYSPLALEGSTALPQAPPADLSIYNSYFYLLTYQNEEQATGSEPIPGVQGHVTSIVVNPTSVPEPATLALLGAGLLGAAFTRRRRS